MAIPTIYTRECNILFHELHKYNPGESFPALEHAVANATEIVTPDPKTTVDPQTWQEGK